MSLFQKFKNLNFNRFFFNFMTYYIMLYPPLDIRLYVRNGWCDWHRMNRTWIDAMLDYVTLILGPTLDFDLGYSRPNIEIGLSQDTGMNCPIGMEREGNELIGCCAHYRTLIFDPTPDFDLGFLMWNCEIAVFQKLMGPLHPRLLCSQPDLASYRLEQMSATKNIILDLWSVICECIKHM